MSRPEMRLLTPVGSTIVGLFLVKHHTGVGGFHASTFAHWFAQMEATGTITVPAEQSSTGQAASLTLDDAFFSPQVLQ